MAIGDRTRQLTVGTSLSFRWFPQLRTAPGEVRAEVARQLDADPRRVGLSKVLLNPRHPAVKLANEHRSQMREHWVTHTLPYVEPGVRLAHRDDARALNVALASDMGTSLAGMARALDESRGELIDDARSRLGSMFVESDYPESFESLLRAEFRFWDLEPPLYLRELAGPVYDAQMEQVAASFRESAALAESMFADELVTMIEHLRERLEGTGDSAPRIFRDSAVNNLREFFDRFHALSIESSWQLEEQIAALQSLMAGVTPDALRSSEPLRDRMRESLDDVAAALEPLTIDAPRRRLSRLDAPTPATVDAVA